MSPQRKRVPTIIRPRLGWSEQEAAALIRARLIKEEEETDGDDDS